MKLLYLSFVFLAFCVCPTMKSLAQPSEKHGFITYDTTFNVGYGGLSYLLHISRPANVDTAARPAFIAMNGAGETGPIDITNRYGPGYWLENGWDGSVQLGNGKHYPIIITVQPNQYWPQTTELLMVLKYILNTYHIKKNSVHLCGLSMGAFAWSSLICHQSTPGGEDGMKLVTSLVCLQGQSNTVSAAVAANELPGYSSFGHWAKKYNGKFFGLEGTIDYRNVGAVSGNMNDSVPGSAYFSYETLGGGAHCAWNAMYDPAATNWASTGTLGPSNAQGASPNAMGTYKTSMNLFQWMLRQGDTSLVSSNLPAHTPPVVDPGGKVTTYLPFNNPTMGGNATAASGGSIASYSWTKVSGPLQYSISNTAIANPVISNLVIGNYVFKLTAMDNMGYSSDSNVAISVNAANSINQTTSPSPIPGKILADSYFSMYGIGTIASNDIGGGLYVGAIHQGSWMNYFVNVATAGRYVVSFRVAAGNTSTGLQMRTANGTVLGSFTVPFTGSYTTWQTITDTVTLSAGIQTLQLIATNPVYYNINWMQFALIPAAATIPGTIQAENFDAMSNVLTQPTTDVGGGLNVGGIYSGSWMSYNVSVAGPGTYQASFRVATPSNGASFQLKLANGTVLANVSVPNTGNFQAWQTVSTNITIPGGNQTIQIVSTSTANWNFNWMQFSTVPVVAAIPGTIQAASFNTMSNVLTQPTTDVGGGLNVGGIYNGSWMSYNVNVAGPGTYQASFRVATPSNGASFQLKLADGTVLANVSVPNTGNYQAWQTVSTNITIPGGNQTIQVVSTSTANWNFHWMQFSTVPVAAAIPGTIQAASFNAMSNVLTQTTTDVGGGLNVGGIYNGSWMSYNVNVAGPGTYTASFRVATPSNGASLQLKLADGTVLANVSLPNTGNYQAWQTVSTNVTIPGGNQTIQVVSTSTANWNFHWMQFSTLAATTAATAAPIPGTIQAASFNAMSGVLTQPTTDVGGGLNVGGIFQGDWMSYNVNVAGPGTYQASFRIATPSNGASLQLKLANGTVLATVNLPNTGNYQAWQTVSTNVTIPGGNQTIQIVSTSVANWNFHWMQFSTLTAAARTSPTVSTAIGNAFSTNGQQDSVNIPSTNASTSFNLYPNPALDHFTIDINNAFTGPMVIQLINQSGAIIRTYTSQKDGQSARQEVNCSGLAAGLYLVRVQVGIGWATVKKWVKL